MDHKEIALRILNNDVALMLELIKKGYESPIFGTVGEHLVYLRRVYTLKNICAYLEGGSDENLGGLVVKKESLEDSFYETDAVKEFVSTFLDLSRKLNYPEITLCFDMTSARSPIRAGLLLKYTNIIHGYKKRYVVLYDDCFAYYRIKEGKKLLRKKMALNTIKDIKMSKRRLIINTIDEKIIFTSNWQDLTEWHRIINGLVKRMNDDEFYMNCYIFRILYCLSDDKNRKELKKIDHLTFYTKDFDDSDENKDEKNDDKKESTPKRKKKKGSKGADVSIIEDSSENDIDESESATENDSEERFYDFEENMEIASIHGLINKEIKKHENLLEVEIPIGLLEPQSFLQRIAESACLFKDMFKEYKSSEEVVFIALFIINLLNLQMNRKLPFKSFMGETFFVKKENMKVFCEQTEKVAVIHAIDENFTMRGVIDLSFKQKKRKIFIQNKSKYTVEIGETKINFTFPNVKKKDKIGFYGHCTIQNQEKTLKLSFHNNSVTGQFSLVDTVYKIEGRLKEIRVLCNDDVYLELFSADLKKINSFEENQSEEELMSSDSRNRADIKAFKRGEMEKVEIERKKIMELEKTNELTFFRLENDNYLLKEGVEDLF